MDCSPPGPSVHGDSPGKNTGVSCHALLQGNLPDPGIEPTSLNRQDWQEGSWPLAAPGKHDCIKLLDLHQHQEGCFQHCWIHPTDTETEAQERGVPLLWQTGTRVCPGHLALLCNETLGPQEGLGGDSTANPLFFTNLEKRRRVKRTI